MLQFTGFQGVGHNLAAEQQRGGRNSQTYPLHLLNTETLVSRTTFSKLEANSIVCLVKFY